MLTGPRQISLAVSASTTSVCVSLDYGKNLYDMNPANLPKMPFVAVFAGFFSVLAAAWSKTSFALTLLRLSQGWLRAVIWFIIVTLNAIMGTAMLFMWVKCRPFAKIWDDSVEGWCIDPAKIVVLYQWSAGM
jgi:H+/Cl- antiporter ClcA